MYPAVPSLLQRVNELKVRTDVVALLDEERLRSIERSKHREWLWRELLCSMATYQRADAGPEMERLLEDLPFSKFTNLGSNEDRRKAIEEALDGKVCSMRYRAKKLGIWARHVEMIEGCGGAEAVGRQILALPTIEDMLNALRRFPQIGDKYSRNILMDVYHSQAMDLIALDSRLDKVAAHYLPDLMQTTMSVPVKCRYVHRQNAFLDVARQAGINGWTLDRMLFHLNDEFVPSVRLKPRC